MITGKESVMQNAISKISENYIYDHEFPIYCDNMRLPNRSEIVSIIKDIQKVVFPAYFCGSEARGMDSKEFIEKTLITIYYQLKTQLELAHSLCKCTKVTKVFDSDRIDEICSEFINEIPNIQNKLIKDIIANFEGDPAATSKAEIILSYPGFYAIFVYRFAHEL